MPFTVRIEAARRLAVVEVDGELMGTMVIEASERVLSHPEWERGMNLLFDYRRVTSTPDMAADVRKVVMYSEQEVERVGDGRCAIVAQNDTVFGLARMYASLLDTPDFQVQVFREIEPALGWLGTSRA